MDLFTRKLIEIKQFEIQSHCDEFVIVYKYSGNHITYSEFAWALGKAECSEAEYELYGAKWTDKGLIYIAKLNENKLLELL